MTLSLATKETSTPPGKTPCHQLQLIFYVLLKQRQRCADALLPANGRSMRGPERMLGEKQYQNERECNNNRAEQERGADRMPVCSNDNCFLCRRQLLDLLNPLFEQRPRPPRHSRPLLGMQRLQLGRHDGAGDRDTEGASERTKEGSGSRCRSHFHRKDCVLNGNHEVRHDEAETHA